MVKRGALLPEAVKASGGHARPPASASDTVDGVVPGVVVEPGSAEGIASTLAWAARAKLTAVVRGTGSKDRWGRPPRPIDVLVRTGGLRRIVAHEASDLTATIEAGARLRDVNRELGRHGQWLPLDPPHEDATIGGVLATNDSGPSRQRYGTPRDLVIGMTIVMADGLTAASGGRVVKNVAGYDIGRLVTGSHGCLAVIAQATFKLAPRPPATGTVRVHLPGPSDALAFVDRLRHLQCEPEALDVNLSRQGAVDRTIVLARFASVEPAVTAAVEQARSVGEALGGTVETSGGPQADAWWSAQRAAGDEDGVARVRLAWKPAEFARVADAVSAATRGTDFELVGRAATGAGVLQLHGDTASQAAVVTAIRANPACRHVIVIDGPIALRREIDPWQTDPSSTVLWAPLKAACDPGDTLGAGRGPL